MIFKISTRGLWPLLLFICSILLVKASAIEQNLTLASGAENGSKPKFKKGQQVADYIASWNLEHNKLTNLTDGDIVPDDKNGGHSRIRRAALKDPLSLWPGGIVPYDFYWSTSFWYRRTIQLAIQDYHRKTCLRFVPKNGNHTRWIRFYTIYSGCWSHVGRQYKSSGAQKLNLGWGCNSKGIAIHEIMHAIGFYHEQSRPDRDDYVKILWDNIITGRKHNFKKQSKSVVDSLGAFYDYDGIMHYSNTAFSKNGRETIQPVRVRIRANGTNTTTVPDISFGQRYGFSDTDVIQINALYRCQNSIGPVWSQWTRWSPCNINCTTKRQRYCFRRNSTECPGANRNYIQIASKPCNCVVDGNWTSWSSWSPCSTSCEEGFHTRTRTCTNPAPRGGGAPCFGKPSETKECWNGFCRQGLHYCDFDNNESPLCHWHSERTYSGSSINPFIRRFYRTPTYGTGPDGDHTKNGRASMWQSEAHFVSLDDFLFIKAGRGYYLYMEATGRSFNSKSRLVSKLFPATPGRKMKFFYYMYGKSVNYLRILMNDTIREREIWRKIGNQGQRWIYGEVILVAARPYKIIFESAVGRTDQSDIALDTIYFTEGIVTSLWSLWSSWSSCSTSCKRTRKRVCLSLDKDNCQSADNFGYETQTASCPNCRVSCDFDNAINPMCHWNSSIDGVYNHMKFKVGQFLVGGSSGCSEVHSSMTGIITSPNYPNKYPNNANCRYLIRNSNPRARITINFLAFRLESSCIYDRIKIYDGESTSANQLGSLNGYCGTSLQNRIFKSSGNALLITFTTDGSVTFSGFQISYRVDAPGVLPTTITPTNTTSNASGDYAFVQYPGYTSLKRAQLMSRIFSPTRGATISFSYYISGTSSRNNLKLVLKGNGQEKSLWKVSGNKGGKWMKAEITYFSPSSYNIIFQAEFIYSSRNYIGLDNIAFSEGNPRPGWSVWTSWGPCDSRCYQRRERYCFDYHRDPSMCPLQRKDNRSSITDYQINKCVTGHCSDNCDFNDNSFPTCHWRQYSRDRLNWNRRNTVLVHNQTNPGAGYHLYLPVASSYYGDVALLLSKYFKPTQRRDMSFLYRMHGRHVNQLRVLIERNSTRTQLLQLYGEQGSQWNRAVVPISSPGSSYKILFEAAAGERTQNDIAVDNIIFTDYEKKIYWGEWTHWSSCSERCTQKRERYCLSSNYSLCQGANENGAEIQVEHCATELCTGDCDFDNDASPLCNWKHVKGRERFIRQRGRTPTAGTGPTGDITKNGTGHYLYLESSYALFNTRAQLRSRVFPATESTMLTFYYYMYGATVNYLKVYISFNGFKRKVWKAHGNMGPTWREGRVMIYSSWPYKIIFEAATGYDYRSDIAIDGIRMRDCLHEDCYEEPDEGPGHECDNGQGDNCPNANQVYSSHGNVTTAAPMSAPNSVI